MVVVIKEFIGAKKELELLENLETQKEKNLLEQDINVLLLNQELQNTKLVKTGKYYK